jgi:ComF family protein
MKVVFSTAEGGSKGGSIAGAIGAALGVGLAAFFPMTCVGCGSRLGWGCAMPVCEKCRPLLRRPAEPACGACGRPIAGAGRAAGDRLRCGACRRHPPPWQSLVAAYLYLPPLVAVVKALKFGRAEHLGEALAVPMAALCAPRATKLDVVTPVPLPWPRLLARGYNQAEAIARPLAATLGLPCRALLRRRPRRRQALLARDERHRNLSGAFLQRGADLAGARVLLVDDVMTTGATLSAAAVALRRAGAAEIVAAVAARTPDASWGEPER